MQRNDSFERPGLSLGFSAKGVIRGCDAIMGYYSLTYQSKKRGSELLLPPRDMQHKATVLTSWPIKGGPVGFPPPSSMITRPLVQGFHYLANWSGVVGGLDPHKRWHQKRRSRSEVGSIARRPKPLLPASPPKVLNLTIQLEFPSELSLRGMTWG